MALTTDIMLNSQKWVSGHPACRILILFQQPTEHDADEVLMPIFDETHVGQASAMMVSWGRPSNGVYVKF
jgi:hypothetical protein